MVVKIVVLSLELRFICKMSQNCTDLSGLLDIEVHTQ